MSTRVNTLVIKRERGHITVRYLDNGRILSCRDDAGDSIRLTIEVMVAVAAAIAKRANE